MSAFKRVPKAVFPPRSCLFCGSFEGPFVDTETDVVGHGHLYICCATENRAGCARQLASHDKMVAKESLEEALATITQLYKKIDELEAREMEFVSLSEVQEAFAVGVLHGDED